MGFRANHLRSIGNGTVVYLVLKSICGNFSSPIRQLCEKLGCLTKRTPRTLGDLFGFVWHLNGQLFPKSASSTKPWLNDLVGHTPFSYVMNKEPEVLEKFVGSGKSHSSSHDAHDLKSLSNSRCKNQGNTCGPYLAPLTLSHGARFGKPAPYASTYLSWMVYLTDDLETGFQGMLDEFKNIDCKKVGCRGNTSGQQCQQSHLPGTHGNSGECQCASVVQCGGTLPLLYRHGFRYNNPLALKDGWYNDGSSWKKQDSYIRKCSHFASQLDNLVKTNSPSTI